MLSYRQNKFSSKDNIATNLRADKATKDKVTSGLREYTKQYDKFKEKWKNTIKNPALWTNNRKLVTGTSLFIVMDFQI
tara:strand:+ start:144 stop:377 length:234 start_codon:yes stop_codon:yes gene_type:complete